MQQLSYFIELGNTVFQLLEGLWVNFSGKDVCKLQQLTGEWYSLGMYYYHEMISEGLDEVTKHRSTPRPSVQRPDLHALTCSTAKAGFG